MAVPCQHPQPCRTCLPVVPGFPEALEQVPVQPYSLRLPTIPQPPPPSTPCDVCGRSLESHFAEGSNGEHPPGAREARAAEAVFRTRSHPGGGVTRTSEPDGWRSMLTGARKETQGKPPMQLLPPLALRLVALGFGYGRGKYGAWNYLQGQGLSLTELAGAAMRHLNAWIAGEDVDAESGCRHLAMAACCVLMILESEERKTGQDDRHR